MPRWIPTLKGLIPDRVEQAIIYLFRQLYELSDRVDGMKGTARAELDFQRIKMALEVGGESPLNVAQLLGVLAQPQLAYAPSVTTLPNASDPSSQDGVLVGLAKILYRFDEATNSWVSATGAGTVTSVGLTQTNTALGAAFTITGSPVTTAGSLNVALTNVPCISTSSKVTAAAPYVNDGKIAVTINGVSVNLMTTA